MKVSCPSCQTNYNIDDKRIPPGGAKLKCARCQHTFPIKPGEGLSSSPEAVPLPGASPQAAVPLPGASLQAAPPAAVPLPGAAPRAAPAPGAFGEAVPLPGVAEFDAGMSGYNSGATHAGPVASGAHRAEETRLEDNPLSQDATRIMAIHLPEDAFRDGTRAGASASYGASQPLDTARDFDFGGAEDTSSLDLGVPGQLGGQPGAGFEERDPFADGPPPEVALPAPDSRSSSPGTERDLDFGGQDMQADSFEVDPFEATPHAPTSIAALQDDPFAIPPPPSVLNRAAEPFPGDDPFALPSLGTEAPTASGYPGGEGTAGAASSPDLGFDFSEPPPTGSHQAFTDAAPGAVNFDFGELPPEVAAPAQGDAGFPDFDDPLAAAPARGSAAPGIPGLDALEFDPSAPKSAATDELEADLSSPLPPSAAAPAADGLEMLSFIDDAAARQQQEPGAASKPKARRFHVRRRSGKVFGPFEEGVIIKMLEDGQLLGNEDVSTDLESWTPIGTVPVFATAIQKLMEGPAGKASTPSMPALGEAAKAGDSAASMDRLRQLYEGRMAAVAVVNTQPRVDLVKLRKYLPHLIGGTIGGALLLVCLGLGFTRYGVFAHKLFFPARVGPGDAVYEQVARARLALLKDSFQSYKQARELSGQVLASKEYPEVRSLWCQAVFYLQRRYAAAASSELEQCHAALEHIALLGEKDTEFLKVTAGDALTRRAPAEVLPLLQEAMAANPGDLELSFLMAEAYAANGQAKQAGDTLQAVLKQHKESAKAFHALGNLHQAANRAQEAVKAYESALGADPTHVISAVELAAVELLVRKDVERGAQAVERALDEKQKAGMGPAELARARALKGVVLELKGQLEGAEAEMRAALKLDTQSVAIKGLLARVLRGKRQFSEALALYKEASEASPRTAEYVAGFIDMLLATGDLNAAQTAVKAASQRFADDARIAYLAGRIDDVRDNLADAEDHYKDAITADPTLVEANVRLGRFYLRQRRTQEAREQFEQAAKKAPERAIVRAGLGELALLDNNVPLALEEFERAIKLSPNLAEAHLGLSRAALALGELERALSEADLALELDPHRLRDGRLQRGTVLWRMGKLDEALAELEKARKEDTRSVNIPVTLGAVQIDRGNIKEAESSLLVALESDPSNTDALYYLARAKAQSAEYAQAIDYMKSAVDRAPKRADLRYTFGLIYRSAKRPGDAVEQWKVTVQLDPRHADAYEALGQVYLERNDFEKATASFEACLKADPKRTRALGFIGDAYFSATRWREAAARYQLALKKDPSLTTLYYKMGRSLSEQYQHAKAIEWYMKATRVEPDNAMPYYYLGYAYKERGKRKQAVAAFEEYLRRKPEAEDRRDIEDEIYDLTH